ncbi:hypothetical protein [Haladaptatus sp. NG-WS-4]
MREDTSEDGSSVDATSPNIVAEAATVGEELHDTIQRTKENASLLDFTTKRPTNASIHEKYLHVLGRAEEKAREINTDVIYLNYREVATHYGCAYTTDGYRLTSSTRLKSWAFSLYFCNPRTRPPRGGKPYIAGSHLTGHERHPGVHHRQP